MIQLENDFVNIVLNYFYYYIAFLECVSPLLPHNVIPQRVRQLYRFAVAERATLELAGEIGNAAAPAVLVGEVVHHLGHGHAGADNIRLYLVVIGFRLSHILTFLLFFRCAL